MSDVSILDFVMIWARSLSGILSTLDISIESGRSDDTQPKLSCWVTLRRGGVEAELVLWDSGEGELATSDRAGIVVEESLVGIDASNLDGVLAKLLRVFV